jgi:hypothetical protein
MPKLDAKKIYKRIQENQIYNEEIHCLMVLNIIGTGGSVAEFCIEAGISDKTYYKWRRKHPKFEECSRLAVMYAMVLWEQEGENNADNPDFNWRYWEGIGTYRFHYGKQARIRINVDETADPYIQYQQILIQAGEGDLTASEIKQLMESINVGIRSYESFKLQQEIDNMRDDIKTMKDHNGNHSSTITEIKGRD